LATVQLFKHHIHRAFYWLALMELALYLLAFYLGNTAYWYAEPARPRDLYTSYTVQALLFALLTWASMVAMGLYQPRLREGSSGILLRTAAAFIFMMLLMSLIVYFVPGLHLWRGVLAYSVAIAFVLSLASRWLFYHVVHLEELNARVLVYGAGRTAGHLITSMRRKSDRRGFIFTGFVHVEGEEDMVADNLVINLAAPLSEYASAQRIDRIVVAVNDRRHHLPMDELLACKLAGIDVLDISNFFEREAGKIVLDYLSPGAIIFADGFRQGPISAFFKRAFDIAASFILLMVAWPVMLLTILAIWIEDGWGAPVVYRQERVGLDGQVFEVLKLRSMRVDAENDGKAQWAKQEDDRITRVGHFIRQMRIDELPQIINVLAGEMAFIGPRPERPQFVQQLAQTIPFYDIRHNVKPGITGWAQLCYPYGANENDAKQKLQFDLYYVKNSSLFLDFTIMLTTVEVVLFGKGAR
jgi:sugar transferase (PEP-CTERM system associated)